VTIKKEANIPLMNEIGHLDEFRVAFHKAMHALVAHSVGATVNEISLKRTVYRDGTDSWDGNVAVEEQSLTTRKIAEIAVAGPLADIHLRIVDNKMLGVDAIKNCVHDIAKTLWEVIDQNEAEKMYATIRDCSGENISVFLGNLANDAQEAFSAVKNISELEVVIGSVIDMIHSNDLCQRAKTVAIHLVRQELTPSSMKSICHGTLDTLLSRLEN